ncbi:MAG: type IIL restriction-modification enzyme MmeI [Chloroflexota bacterium]
MSTVKYHSEWLSLIDISGPFLNIATLERVFPQGVYALESARAQELRAAYDEWDAEAAHDPRFHRAWVRYVLETLLEWNDTCLADGQAIPEPFKYTAIEHGGETIRPDYMLHQPGQSNNARALVCVYPFGLPLEKPMPHALWSASPAARTFALLRATGVRIGIVTNGEQWMLINAPTTGLAGYVSWYAEIWQEERDTLRAFFSLLGVSRFFGVADEDTLEAMLDESANDAQEVTDQLGLQVRHAVEILVRSLDRADQDSGGTLLAGVREAELYQAALTVMMRLVFLLSAEERGLFLLGDPLYDQSYAASTLRAQLHETADRTGEDVLERRADAWSRLLATFRLVYYGAAHEDLRLPAYGGSLFDPDRFPFLEGHVDGLDDTPPNVDNRTVLHLLDALQVLQSKGEARRLSFRALDIEQIGHVYEGLLDHEARRAEEVMLGFTGGIEPEIPLSALLIQTDADLHKFLKEATGRSSLNTIKNALSKPFDPDRARRLRTICRDEALFDAVLPFLNLLRDDEFGYPVVVLPGSVFVTAGSERRATGTHYTPRSLTEPIVQHTLEPLVYRGMAEGLPAEQWALKSPREILAFKVCDMAMGSGAFLVQVCRYLAARLIEAWEQRIEVENTPIPRLTIEGDTPTGALTDILIPDDPNERTTLALRLIADRCLYGVDKNPLAVEMAKLSLWLTTLAKGRPFTFLDHALKCGDSLLGVSLNQLRLWNLDPDADDVPLFRIRLRERADEIVTLRLQLESFPVNTVEDQQRKESLHHEAETRMNDLRAAADHLVLSYLIDGLNDKQREALRLRLLDALIHGHDLTPEDYDALLPIFHRYNPFHWELEFPEVFPNERGGFDAFVGNPPFQGGQHLTGQLGIPYRNYLVDFIANGQKGSADLCAYFFLRAHGNLRTGGTFGLIATNTIAQGDTRDVGLIQLEKTGATLYRAYNDLVWPGVAAVVVDVVHIRKGDYLNICYLDNEAVEFITPLLDDIALQGQYLPKKLQANADKSFKGVVILGMGFVMEPEEAQMLIQKDPHNADVLFPYVNGEDLNDTPDQSATRWAINFFDWKVEQAIEYPDCYAIVREKVYPERMKQNREIRKRYWWRYGETAPALHRAIASLSQTLVVTQTSKFHGFVFKNQNIVFDQKLVIFPFSQFAPFAVLQSTVHVKWLYRHGSTLETRPVYTPSDCFETFPFPPTEALALLEGIGEIYHETRRQIMLNRQEGLTATYNRFHNPDERSSDIQALCDLHRQMDEAVAAAYGWDDLPLEHAFHDTAQGMRYTISEAARREILKRLLALNFERYEEEQRLGLGVPGKKGKRKTKASDTLQPEGDGGEADPNAPPPEQLTFFDDDTPKQKRLL